MPAELLANGGMGKPIEPYEGSIVTVHDVVITNPAGGTEPTWWFQATGGILVANDFGITELAPLQGMKLKSLTGAVKRAKGRYLIAPRSVADIAL